MPQKVVSARLMLQLRDWARGWSDASKKGQSALKQMQNSVRDWGNKTQAETRKATGAFGKFASGLKSGAGGAIRSIASMTLAFTGAQLAMVALQSAFRGFIGGMIGFESTMTKTINLTSLTEEELAGVQDRLKDMAPEIGKSPNELAEAFYFAISALGDTDDALGALEAAAKGSAAGMGKTETIVDAVTSAMNAYNISGDKAIGVTDTFAAAIKAGKMEPVALAQSIGMVLPMAAYLGINLQEVTASMATMTRIGIDVPMATTALRGLFNAFIQGSPATEAALGKMGLSMKGLRDVAGKDGLLAVLDLLMDKTGGNIELISQIIPNVRALTAVLATSGVQGETYANILGEINEAGGLVSEGFERYQQTFEYQSARFREIVRTSFYDFAERILPYVTSALQAFITFIKSGWDLSILRDELKELGIDIKAIVPILHAYGTGLKTVWQAGVRVNAFLREHKIALIAAAVALSVLFAWMHPLLAAIAGITLAIGLLRDNWDMLAQKVEWLREVIHRNFAWVEEYIKGVWTIIWEYISHAIDQIRNTVRLVMAVIQGDWGEAWDALQDMVKRAFDHVLTMAGGFGRVFKAVWDGIWKGVAWILVQAINAIIGKINEFVGGLDKVLSPIKGLLGKVGIDVPDIGKIPTITAPKWGMDFGGFGGPAGADADEVARFTRATGDYKRRQAAKEAKEAKALQDEIDRIRRLGDKYKEGLEETLIPSMEEGGGAAVKAEKSAKDMAEKLDTAATTIGKAVAKFVDPIEQAFREFYWAWRKTGLMWQDFVQQAFAKEVPKLQHGIRNFAGGLAVVADRGPELLRLPRGTDVYSAGETSRMMRGGAAGRGSTANSFSINVEGNTWPEMRQRVLELLDEAAASAGLSHPHTTGSVGGGRL